MELDLKYEIRKVQDAIYDMFDEAAEQIISIAGGCAGDGGEGVSGCADALVDEAAAKIEVAVFGTVGATANKVKIRGKLYRAIADKVNSMNQVDDEMVYRIGTEGADGTVEEGYNPCAPGFGWGGVRLMYVPNPEMAEV